MKIALEILSWLNLIGGLIGGFLIIDSMGFSVAVIMWISATTVFILLNSLKSHLENQKRIIMLLSGNSWVCTKCGEVNNNNEESCRGCYTSAKACKPHKSMEKRELPHTEMWTCPKCGALNSRHSEKCTSCEQIK